MQQLYMVVIIVMVMVMVIYLIKPPIQYVVSFLPKRNASALGAQIEQHSRLVKAGNTGKLHICPLAQG
jgi:hypothetical protein